MRKIAFKKVTFQTYIGKIVAVMMDGETVANIKYEPDSQYDIDLPVNIANFVFYAASDRIRSTGHIDCLLIA